MRDSRSDIEDELGAHPNDYTNISDDADGIMICLRCLTHAVIRIAKALEARSKTEGT